MWRGAGPKLSLSSNRRQTLWNPVPISPKGHGPIATFLIDLFSFLFLEGNKLERGRKKEKKKIHALKGCKNIITMLWTTLHLWYNLTRCNGRKVFFLEQLAWLCEHLHNTKTKPLTFQFRFLSLILCWYKLIMLLWCSSFYVCFSL